MDLCTYVWVCVSVRMIRVDCIYDEGTMKNAHTYSQTNITPSFQAIRESNEPTKRINLFLYLNRQRVSVNCLPITLWANKIARSHIKLCCFRRTHSIYFLNLAKIYFIGTEDLLCRWNMLYLVIDTRVIRFILSEKMWWNNCWNVRLKPYLTMMRRCACSFSFFHLLHTVFRTVI